MDDLEVRVRFAIQDELMFTGLGSGDVRKMFLREPVIPTAVPSGEHMPLRMVGVIGWYYLAK
ncbi:hypothetical protein [Tardiphaga sp. OK246]|uniref:hypothetical protein n=1 Tax=Tardiphaga sp. OK246 TaxID=1855307 RepID=UPI0015961762|nr:hypothetical protein [Tardiphaga sp. OK246]